MRRRGLKNPDIAKRVDRHPGTISKWRTGLQLPDPPEFAVLAELLQVPVGWLRDGEVEYGAAVELPVSLPATASTASEPRHLPETYPQRVKSLIREFEVELTNEGATEWEIAFCRSVLTSPAARVMYQGGAKRDMTDEEWHTEVSALIVGLRAWLRERKKRRRGGGA